MTFPKISFMLAALFACTIGAGEVNAIYSVAGNRGGLVVHYDCGDGNLAAALAGRKDMVVQGLTRDAGAVDSARKLIRSKGLCGQVSIRLWSSELLPYADGVVNLLVTSKPIDGGDAARVLAPRGVLLTKAGVTGATHGLKPSNAPAGWRAFTKPVPAEMDEWTHYLHAADNNAVAKDTLVGAPKYLRWDGGPKYSRNHEIDVSVVSVVTGNGRLFCVVDEGPTGTMGKYLPQEWALVARDAFSGVILWRRAVPNMGWPVWKPNMAKADWSKLVAQRRLVPITLPRRIVAVGDQLYTSLGYQAPLVALDAATGKTVKTYDGAAGVDEILVQDDTIIVCNRPKNRASYDEPGKAIWLRTYKEQITYPGEVVVFDRSSGRQLWKQSARNLLPLSLTATAERVFYHTGSAVVCLDRKTGRQQWKTANDNAQSYRWNVTHTVVAHGQALIIATAKKIDVFSIETGKLLWSGKGGRMGFGGTGGSNPTNVYVIDNLVWAPKSARSADGLKLLTGEVGRTIPLPKYMYTSGHHVRCYRGKATDKYILENKRGIEMIGVDGKSFIKNDWVRGMCRYGILPANGLIYSTPTPCSCYPEVLLTGFNALASTRAARTPRPEFRKGPAFGATGPDAANDDWPTFRGNMVRNGTAATAVAAEPAQIWKVKLGGKLTQPVVAAGKIFVASVHQQTLQALDAATGRIIWQYTAASRIDSPPTYHKGVLYFGTHGGKVLAVSSRDGREVWQHRIAPTNEQIVSYNQVGSVWPVHGSTLIVDDVVYAAAGRNIYLDGGIVAVGLDCTSGAKRYEARFNAKQQNPATDKSNAHDLPGVTMDIMSCDGAHLYLGNIALDKQLTKLKTTEPRHLQAVGGFIDDYAWNRNMWKYSANYPGFNERKSQKDLLSGQILVHDGKLLYGTQYFLGHSGQSSVCYPGQKGYRLFAASLDASATTSKKKRGGKKRKGKKGAAPAAPAAGVAWESLVPVRVRAMVKADDTLFIAGPPDVVDHGDPLGAFEGRGPALLRAYSAADGKQKAEVNLPSQPVFDGLIAAGGRLYIAHTNGELSCWK